MKMSKLLKGFKIGALVSMMSMPAIATDLRPKFAGTFLLDHPDTGMVEQIKADTEAADVGLKVSMFLANLLADDLGYDFEDPRNLLT